MLMPRGCEGDWVIHRAITLAHSSLMIPKAERGAHIVMILAASIPQHCARLGLAPSATTDQSNMGCHFNRSSSFPHTPRLTSFNIPPRTQRLAISRRFGHTVTALGRAKPPPSPLVCILPPYLVLLSVLNLPNRLKTFKRHRTWTRTTLCTVSGRSRKSRQTTAMLGGNMATRTRAIAKSARPLWTTGTEESFQVDQRRDSWVQQATPILSRQTRILHFKSTTHTTAAIFFIQLVPSPRSVRPTGTLMYDNMRTRLSTTSH